MPSAKIARIDIDANEIATAPRKIDIGIVGDCKMVLNQILTGMKGKVDPDRFNDWRKRLADGVAEKLTCARRQQADRGRRYPSPALVRGDQQLHRARRHPGG